MGWRWPLGPAARVWKDGGDPRASAASGPQTRSAVGRREGSRGAPEVGAAGPEVVASGRQAPRPTHLGGAHTEVEPSARRAVDARLC